MELQNVLFLKIIPVHHTKVSEETVFKAVPRTFIFMGPLLISSAVFYFPLESADITSNLVQTYYSTWLL